MKITAAVWKLLPAEIQSTFTIVAGTSGESAEYDNGEESAGGLKTALQKEKEEAAKLKTKLTEFETAKTAEIEAARKKALEEARSSGDFKKIEDDYKRQLKERDERLAKIETDNQNRIKADAVGKQVDELSKMFVSPALAKTFIQGRLTAELVDGSPIVRVLDKDGKASALSVEDLKKEFLTNAELKSSLVASKGTGGGSGVPSGGGGSGSDNKDEKFDAASADPKSLIARIEAKGLVDSGDDD